MRVDLVHHGPALAWEGGREGGRGRPHMLLAGACTCTYYGDGRILATIQFRGV